MAQFVEPFLADPIAWLSAYKPNKAAGKGKTKVTDIMALIDYANKRYHNGHAVMDDDMYDMLIEIVREVDPKNRILRSIGASVEGAKVPLRYHMGSMNKIKPENADMFNKWVAKNYPPYITSDKLDGVSALYTNGRLYTRGDGKEGRDITHLLQWIQLPKIDPAAAVRGELIMTKEAFDKYRGGGMKNARNMVAGIVNGGSKSLNPAHVKDVLFITYELIHPWYNDQIAQFQELEKMGFHVVPHGAFDKIDLPQLEKLLTKRRKDSPFKIDGIIVSSVRIPNRNVDGNPDYAFAFKANLQEQVVEATVVAVEWEVSKHGSFKPRVRLEPVQLEDVTISYATAFNAKYVKENGLGPGAVIRLVRSGDVIPHILEVIKPVEPSFPAEPYTWDKRQTDIKIVGVSEQQRINALVDMAKKLGIRNVSEKIIEKMYEAKLLRNVVDLTKVTKEQLAKLPGFKDRMTERTFDTITKAINSMSMVPFMTATNVFGQGIGDKKLTAAFLHDSAWLENARTQTKQQIVEALIKVDSIQDTTATLIAEGLPAFFKLFDMLSQELQAQLRRTIPMRPKAGPSAHPIKGKRIAFSGFRDADVEAAIERWGGVIASSVSSKTDAVVVHDKEDVDSTSSKVVKAKELGKPVFYLEEFLKEYKITLFSA